MHVSLRMHSVTSPIPGVIPGLRNRNCSPALLGSQTVSKPGMTPGSGMTLGGIGMRIHAKG